MFFFCFGFGRFIFIVVKWYVLKRTCTQTILGMYVCSFMYLWDEANGLAVRWFNRNPQVHFIRHGLMFLDLLTVQEEWWNRRNSWKRPWKKQGFLDDIVLQKKDDIGAATLQLVDSPSWTDCRSSFSSGGLFLGLGGISVLPICMTSVYIYLNLPVPQPILIRLTCGKTTRVAEGAPVLTCRCGLCGYRALVAGFATSKLESSMYAPSSSAGIGIVCDQIMVIFQSKWVGFPEKDEHFPRYQDDIWRFWMTLPFFLLNFRSEGSNSWVMY